MRHKKRKMKGLVLAVIGAGIIATSAYAFTATITVSASKAGDGAGTVAALPNVTPSYTLDASGKIATVRLAFASGVTYSNVAAAASTQIKFQYGTTWSDACTGASNGSPTVFTCLFTGAGNPSVSSIATNEVVGVDTINP
jgi:hypothetical protein